MSRCLFLAIAVCLILAVSARADEKAAKDPESYARIELKGRLWELKGSSEYGAAQWPGFHVEGPGDRVLTALPMWELDFGEDKDLSTAAKKLLGKVVRVRGEVRTKFEGGFNSPTIRRVIVKVASLEQAEDKK